MRQATRACRVALTDTSDGLCGVPLVNATVPSFATEKSPPVYGRSRLLAAQALGHRLEPAVQVDARDLRYRAVVVAHVEAASVRGPLRLVDRAIETAGERSRRAAVAIHHVELGVLVAHEPIVEAEIRDGTAVGRHGGRAIGADASRQRTDGSARECDLVDLRVDGLAAPVIHPVPGDEHVAPVRRPRQRPGLVEGAEGELPRRAAVRRDDVHVAVARLEIAFGVAAVGEIGDHLQRRSPLRAFRLRRGFTEFRGFVRREHRKGDPLPVR